MDDTEYAVRVDSMGFKVLETPAVMIEHLLFKPSLLSNQARYLMMRNTCYLAFRKNIKWKYRFRAILYVIYLPMAEFLRSWMDRDFGFFISVLLGCNDFLTRSLTLQLPVVKNGYAWIEATDPRTKTAVDFRPFRNRLFLKTAYHVPDLSGDGRLFFARRSSKD